MFKTGDIVLISERAAFQNEEQKNVRGMAGMVVLEKDSKTCADTVPVNVTYSAESPSGAKIQKSECHYWLHEDLSPYSHAVGDIVDIYRHAYVLSSSDKKLRGRRGRIEHIYPDGKWAIVKTDGDEHKVMVRVADLISLRIPRTEP